MRAAAHEARMRAPDSKGFATRLSYQGLVKRAALAHGDGSTQHQRALADLEGPEMPETLGYLWSWFLELERTRHHGMSGPAALTYPTIEAWARLTGRTPDALEVDALLLLDVVSRYPDAVKEDVDG